jgi:serine/threonine protein kinase
MKGMMRAVAYIHGTLRIVHRDLKLQNWLYPSRTSPDDRLKLIDFGFSKIMSQRAGGGQGARKNAKKVVAVNAGTVAYMAPELLQEVRTTNY